MVNFTLRKVSGKDSQKSCALNLKTKNFPGGCFRAFESGNITKAWKIGSMAYTETAYHLGTEDEVVKGHRSRS